MPTRNATTRNRAYTEPEVVTNDSAVDENAVEMKSKVDTNKKESKAERIARKIKNLRERGAVADRDILKLKPKPGYRRRWVSDTKEGTRIARYQEMGYEFVRGYDNLDVPESAKIEHPLGEVVTRSGGKDVKLYAMEIEEEVAVEIENLRQSKVNAIERDMNRSKGTKDNPNRDGTYGGAVIEEGTVEIVRNE